MSRRAVATDRAADPARARQAQGWATSGSGASGDGGILYWLMAGCQWKVLSRDFGCGSTCHLRFQKKWVQLGPPHSYPFSQPRS
jgi:hypothetical protein